MRGSTDSCAQKLLDPASMLPSYCNASLLNSRKKISHFSPKKTKRYSKRAGAANKGMEVQVRDVECSMCGDVGIAEFLFLCSECSLRHQHTYCGRSYPHFGGKASICNWCLHEQDSLITSAAKESAISLVEELQNPAPVRVNQGYSDGALVEITGRHGKAFDYLLLIAAQSSLPQVISEPNDKIKQAASMINITGPRISRDSSGNEAIWESDKKAFIKTGLSEINGSSKNQAKMQSSDRGRSMTGIVRKLNMEIQGAVNALKVEGTMDQGGAVYAGKRLRCSKGVEMPAFKCRKRGLQVPTPAKPIFRRYKLLADVVC